MAGFAIALEQPSRRHEIALYIAGQAVHSFYFTWKNYLPQVRIYVRVSRVSARVFHLWFFANIHVLLTQLPQGEVLVFAFATSILMHVFVEQPHLMRSGYFSLFRYFQLYL